MNGRRAKILRRQAEAMTVKAPGRRLHAVDLQPRERWVDVPDDGKTLIERLRNKFLRSMGLPTPMKREKRWVTPQVIREQKGTTRWVYKHLKRMYYRLRMA